jgi:hypothetical protein
MLRFEDSEELRQFAGSRRVASKYSLQSTPNTQTPPLDASTPFTLPTSSEELGRFPYSQPDSSTTMPLFNPELFPATDMGDPLLYPPVVGDGSSWPTDVNMGQSMDDLFYDQMATIFSTPFGVMTEEELATSILNNSTLQTIPNDEPDKWYQAPVDPKWESLTPNFLSVSDRYTNLPLTRLWESYQYQ